MINGVHAMVLNGEKKILGFLRIFMRAVIAVSSLHFIWTKPNLKPLPDFYLRLHFTCLGTHFM